MKVLFLPALLLLAGCQTTDPVLTPLPDFPPDDIPVPARSAANTSAVSDWEETIRRQKLILKALAEHNDTLTARINAAEPVAEPLPSLFVGAAETPRPEEPETPPAPVAVAPPPTLPANAVVHVPDADGRIELSNTNDSKKSALPNPFAVRHPAGDAAGAAREIVLNVQGIFGGATPSALVNDRVCQVGDLFESFRVAHITADSLLLSVDGALVFLKLPLGATTLRLP